jgi:predicted DNA-binding transcriptional regulator AlpA
MTDTATPRLLRQADQARLLGVSRWTIRRIAATDPTYPPSIELTAGVCGVLAEELDKWLRARPLRSARRRGARRTDGSAARGGE